MDMRGNIPRQVGLTCVRKLAEQAKEWAHEQCSSVISASASALTSLGGGLWPRSIRQVILSFPSCFDQKFYHNNRKETEIVHVCMPVYVHVYMWMYICVGMCMCGCIYVYASTCVDVGVCVCVTIVYVHACGFVGVEAYICISIVYMCAGEYVCVSIVCICACGYGLLLRSLATSSRIFFSLIQTPMCMMCQATTSWQPLGCNSNKPK